MLACPGALFSFNLALNDLEEYEGGGTYFRRLEGSGGAAALRSPKGHLLAHSSALVHGGHPISSGVRYTPNESNPSPSPNPYPDPGH